MTKSKDKGIRVIDVDAGFGFEEQAAPNPFDDIEIGQWYWVSDKEEEEEEEEASEHEEYFFDEDEDEEEEPEEEEEEDRSGPMTDSDGKFSMYKALDNDRTRLDKKGRWLGCVYHIGSNYIQLKGVMFETRSSSNSYRERVHMDEFFGRCEREKRPNKYLKKKIKYEKSEIRGLMDRVKRITAALGVAPKEQLGEGVSETQALAVRNDNDIPEYKAALVKAKKETLPNLFEEIKFRNAKMVGWMKGKMIPMKAEQAKNDGVIGLIDQRIFSVELYAGLIEQVTKVADGDPAHNDSKLYLMQRRCYMDEECLANYTAGGMGFHDIRAFDNWLSKPENRDRVLPHPRCMVSFRVRRFDKQREQARSISEALGYWKLDEANKLTYLYIRNGDQLFRLETEIEFGEKLFPDLDKSALNSGQQVWTRLDYGKVKDLITDDQYEGMKEDYLKGMAVWQAKYDAWEAEKEVWKTRSDSYKEENRHKKPSHFSPSGKPTNPEGKWTLFTPDTVYYDDITEKIASDIQQYNRIALIIQGLLDRSLVLHPHPPYQVWTGEGFVQAIELVYDDSRALNPANMPIFEEYRAGLNESLKKGCMTVGQEDYWERAEAHKENHRYRSYYDRSDYTHTRYRPHGNPGPGLVAEVTSISKKKGTCSFKWEKERTRVVSRWEDGSPTVPTKIAVPRDKLFNVSAYKPGDYKIFFADPRIRLNYLEWAPFMMAAEDYHAGKIEKGQKRK